MSEQASWDAWHRKGNYSEADDIANTWTALAMPFIACYAQGHAVLEIACGRGSLAARIATLAPLEFVAADYSPAAIDIARQRLADHANVTAIVADIQDLPFDAERFDLVVSLETIEHVPDPAGAVAELARVLAPGGHLIITTPNYLGLMGLFRAYRRLVGRPFKEAGQPINNLTALPRTRRWVRNAGLDIVYSRASDHYLPRRGKRAARVGWLPADRWFGLYSITVAAKPNR